ncbi:hypothetical protein PHO31112_02055 [Pandoraea horticolens]|uniref:Uncharacterized protein n=1 Tax=Pandoraea horticolens TaxID=2508298 RepID=A0A5E4UKZ5_9BURK|nr:hypothetical protein PHO31112_02055 [Pandoraea horticolens]
MSVMSEARARGEPKKSSPRRQGKHVEHMLLAQRGFQHTLIALGDLYRAHQIDALEQVLGVHVEHSQAGA